MEALKKYDPILHQAIEAEKIRQHYSIELIASENIVSQAVLEAQGSILTNKYAEGYPGKRYYNGCKHVDTVESLAIERVCKLFGCKYANVQPHSGSSANIAAFAALISPGETILAMSLNSGGHLTHGAKVSLSGKWFNAIGYDVETDGSLNYDKIEALALEHKPKLIIAGFSSYSGLLDWKRFREIADKIGAYFMADIAHVAGLIAGGAYPSPIPYAHVTTSTTHKTLRGPRGAIILSNDEEIAKKINFAVFPGCQGGPLMHVIAGKAVAFLEAQKADFAIYAKQVVSNCKAMAKIFTARGINLLGKSIECHILIIDLRSKANINGKLMADALEMAGLIANKNAVPQDPLPPVKTSGIRIGTPAGTTRGFKEKEFEQIASWIADIIEDLQNKNGEIEKSQPLIDKIKKDVMVLCNAFPAHR